MDKRTFKICEAVALGLTHYYMGPNDRRELTDGEKVMAGHIIPNLPEGWMREQHVWDCCSGGKFDEKRIKREELRKSRKQNEKRA